jgi:hypothetical protein
LIIRIRDESHRFAQRYHHKLFLSMLKLWLFCKFQHILN